MVKLNKFIGLGKRNRTTFSEKQKNIIYCTLGILIMFAPFPLLNVGFGLILDKLFNKRNMKELYYEDVEHFIGAGIALPIISLLINSLILTKLIGA